MKLGSTHSAEAKAKLSEFRSGKSFTTGTKRTDEQKATMRAAALRRLADPDQMAKLRAAGLVAAKGRKLPVAERDAREKARQACKRMRRRVLTMARVRKDATTEQLLGYTQAQLRAHLESQFQPGMSWSARDSFHIDHRHPVAEFFRQGIFDPKVINALDNLQVLTPAQNRAKSDRIITISNRGTEAGIQKV